MQDGGLAAMFSTAKGPVEAVKEWLATRFAEGKQAMRNTRGNPDFTRTATIFYALSRDATDLHKGRPTGGPALEFEDLVDLTDFMAFSLAGHDGWETQQAVHSIEAAAEGKTIVQSASPASRHPDR